MAYGTRDLAISNKRLSSNLHLFPKAFRKCAKSSSDITFAKTQKVVNNEVNVAIQLPVMSHSRFALESSCLN